VNSNGTTERILFLESCWMMVAICVRWLFDALVTIENFTGVPAESVRSPFGDQEIRQSATAFFLIDRTCRMGIELLTQKLLAE